MNIFKNTLKSNCVLQIQYSSIDQRKFNLSSVLNISKSRLRDMSKHLAELWKSLFTLSSVIELIWKWFCVSVSVFKYEIGFCDRDARILYNEVNQLSLDSKLRPLNDSNELNYVFFFTLTLFFIFLWFSIFACLLRGC